MKKKIVSILLSAAMLLGAVGLSACANSENLAEMEAKIAELEAQIEELQSSLTEQQEQIAQKDEAFKNYISNNGGLITLSYAYFLGLISKDDLLSIAYYNNYNSNYGNEEIMSEDFVPQTKIPLPEKVEEEIKEAVKENRKKSDNYIDEIIIDGVTYPLEDKVNFTGYYGTYNNCVAFSCANGGLTVVSTENIDGIKFFYPMPNDYIIIWVNSDPI